MSSVAEVYPPRYSGGGHRDGQIIPHKFCTFTWTRAVPEVFEAFDKRVPDEFWSIDELEDETRVAIIACPCGESPVVSFANFGVCECDRAFMFVGDSVRVARLEETDDEEETPKLEEQPPE